MTFANMGNSATQRLLGFAVMVPLFMALSWLGIEVFRASGYVTTVKPICGAALAIALIGGPGAIWRVAIAVFVSNLAVRFAMGVPVLLSLWTAVSVTLSVVGVYFAAHRFIGRPMDFRNWWHLVSFMTGSIAVSAFTGVIYSLVAYGDAPDFWHYFEAWWIPAALSFAVFTPAIVLSAGVESRFIVSHKYRFAGAFALLAAALAVNLSPGTMPSLFLIPLALLVISLTCEMEGASLGMVVTTLAFTMGTVTGHSMLGRSRMTLGQELYFIQIFLGVLSIVILPAGAVVSARRRLQDELVRLLRSEESTSRELREQESRLRLLADEAQAANRAKSEFLANVSHELRTPLTSVIGFADLLHEDTSLSGQSRGFVDRVRTGGRTLLSTINDVLDYSSLESGGLSITPAPACIAEVAVDVVQLLANQAEQKNLSLVLSVAPALRGAVLDIDTHRMRQLLLNLAGNAIKFTEAGSVTLVLSMTQEFLRCEVRDTGPGIAYADLDKLFQRFSQVDGSATRQHGGTGLGLAICRGIVMAMGGEIGVNSVRGEGSTFWFEVPVRAGHAQADAPQGAVALGNAGGLAILVVDDVDANRLFVTAALAALDVEITDAASGEQAVELAGLAQFDIILMDIRMPGMGGLAAMRAIRAADPHGCPIVAFTGEGDVQARDQFLAAGFSDVLSKPLTAAALRACICNRGQALSDRHEEKHVA